MNATIQQQLQNATATNANNNNNNNLSAKFKIIKTISVSTAQSNINNNQLNTQKFLNSKFKNHQFIASQLNNNNNNNNNNGQPIKINSSLSNRLRIEEIKKQQQEHVAKQLLLRANELTIDSNESHNNNHGNNHSNNNNHNNTIKEELKSESEPKEKSGAESEIATSELHISTKTGKKKTVGLTELLLE